MTSFAPIRVRVPASTSNLGPGFDLLGIALDLWLDVEVRAGAPDGERHRWIEREGTATEWPATGGLVFEAFERGLEQLNVTKLPATFEWTARSEIPICRGLGSSGAAIVAGLMCASACAPEPVPAREWVDLAAQLEGHPDNSTASLLGGCTLGLPSEGRMHVVEQELHPDLRFVVVWPTTTVATEAARAVLPTNVPFQDAVDNPRRLAFLLEGLRTANSELLRLGSVDHLHVEPRLTLNPGAREALSAAYARGAALATVSGSGSALVAIGAQREIDEIGSAMLSTFRASQVVAQGRSVTPVLGSPQIERL